jgi:hypothetical protein
VEGALVDEGSHGASFRSHRLQQFAIDSFHASEGVPDHLPVVLSDHVAGANLLFQGGDQVVEALDFQVQLDR